MWRGKFSRQIAAAVAAWAQGNWEATTTVTKDRSPLQRLSPPKVTFSPMNGNLGHVLLPLHQLELEMTNPYRPGTLYPLQAFCNEYENKRSH
ncbi:hypothetical protein E2562_036634 [Oryza meyeriana var. granulata]|uniref:Uncharacterized protein n=1 Tax=Oryza meyeriana var. granulata TaxID=110450 RepID=A0A6G1DAM7_9ORYZ|nr:hypothetical protein E2562_036634 [Oryza meyeriana var. granulata]